MLLPIEAAISFTVCLACRPSAMAIRSSWVRKRGEIGPGPGTIMLPASMNHSEPQLVETPTLRAAAAPLYPSRNSSKYHFFTAVGILLGAYLGIRTPSLRGVRNHR